MNFIALSGWISACFGVLALIIIGFHSSVGKKSSRTALFLCILSFTYCIILNNLHYTGLTEKFVHTFRTGIPLELTLGPLSFLYYKYNHSKSRFRKNDLLHFIPFGIYLLDLLPFYLKGTAVKVEVVQYYMDYPVEIFTTLPESFLGLPNVHVLVAISFLSYSSCTLYKIVKSKSLELRKGSKFWYIFFSVFLISVGVLLLTLIFTGLPQAYVIYSAVVFLFFLVLTILLFLKPEVVYEEYFQKELVQGSSSSTSITLTESHLLSIKNQLITYFDTAHPYLDTNYSINKLASDLKISRSYISITINHGLGHSFNDFVNLHRLLYFQNNHSLFHPDKMVIAGIANQIGFKSRTTFFHAVKKYTGLTPSEFIKRVKRNEKLITPLF
jgi:AraC-like DNA-binding protein